MILMKYCKGIKVYFESINFVIVMCYLTFKNNIITRFCILTILLLLLSGCRRSNVYLGHGYHLERSHSEFHAVLKDNLVIIDADIKSYGNDEVLFYGYLLMDDYVKYHLGEDVDHTGYFHLDKMSGKVVFGLSESDWRLQLRSYGILNPELTKTD